MDATQACSLRKAHIELRQQLCQLKNAALAASASYVNCANKQLRRWCVPDERWLGEGASLVLLSRASGGPYRKARSKTVSRDISRRCSCSWPAEEEEIVVDSSEDR